MRKSKLQRTTWSLISRLSRDFIKPYAGQFIAALAFMGLAAAMTAAFASLVKPVLDDVLVGRKADMILPVAFSFFVVFLLRGLSTYAHTIMMYKIGQHIVADIQKALTDKVIGLDLRFFHDNPSGQLISRVVNDVTVVRVALGDTLTGFGKSILTLVLLVGVMFYQDWKLAIAAFVIFPFTSMFVAKIGKKLRRISAGIQARVGHLSDLLSQVFQGIRLVKAYDMEDYERRRVAGAIHDVRDMVIKSVRVGNMSTPVNEFLVGLVVFGIIVYGGYQVAGGHSTAGTLISFITAFTLAYEPMKKLASLNNTLQMGLGASERVFDLLDLKPQVTDRQGAIELKLNAKAPDIVLENVCFQYHSDDRKALDGVSLTIPAGKVTALVGPSGSGKTTILNLIPRFYDVTGGRITIEGRDLRDYTIASLRRHMALVSQDITIFDDTVHANIAYGSLDATEDQVIEAAKAAAADEFIRALPEGYNTRLGEDGVKLSGGQRQRIAIARAILHDAPILLLDEATSALDNEAERAIQATLAELEKGRTTLVIAHRLSTIQNADQIIVLSEGRIAETGQHNQLIESRGIYARLHDLVHRAG